jgi:hypothetical protein
MTQDERNESIMMGIVLIPLYEALARLAIGFVHLLLKVLLVPVLSLF